MSSVRNTVRRYYLYKLTTSYGFYLPVSIVYLSVVRGFGGVALGLVQAAFTVGMVVAEIPTGYVGDRLGKRYALACGKLLSVAVLCVYVFLDSPVEYMLLQFVWAIGWTMQSGTSDALLYELLAKHDETDRFGAIAGRANAVTLGTSAVTAVLSGSLSTIDWLVPFVANAVLVGIGIPVLLSLPAPVATESTERSSFSMTAAIETVTTTLRLPSVRWFVLYVAVIYGLASLTRTFEQPAARAVGVSIAEIGLLYAGFKLVSTVVSGSTEWVQQRWGLRGVFGLALPVVGVAYASLAVVPVAVLPVLFLSRSFRTLLTPLQNQYLNDRIDGAGRATILSAASMVFSVGASGANVVGGLVVEQLGVIAALSVAGCTATAIGSVLWVAVGPVCSVSDRREGSVSG